MVMRILAILCLLCTLLTACPAAAEPVVPVTIWQKERRVMVGQGDVLTLQSGPFFLILPMQKADILSLAVGPSPAPSKLEAFEPGRGMAGPYLGSLFLDWQAHHYFDYDPEVGPSRTELWDRPKAQVYYRVTELLRRQSDGELRQLSWEEAPNLEFIVRKEGFEELRFQVRWSTTLHQWSAL